MTASVLAVVSSNMDGVHVSPWIHVHVRSYT